MDREAILERIRQIEAALDEEPQELATSNSAESARTSSGLAQLPYLTINDIILLRDAGMHDLEEIEARILEVPEQAWPHVLDLVKARVLEVATSGLEGTNGHHDGEVEPDRCLALTKSGDRCKNSARTGSSYCSSHKGYQPSQAELKARRRGLLHAG